MKTLKFSENTYDGTIADFVADGLTINEQPLDVVSMSTLARLNFFEKVGERKPARGRSAAVYRVTLDNKTKFQVFNA